MCWCWTQSSTQIQYSKHFFNLPLELWPIFNQYCIYMETRQLVFTSKIFEKQLWKSEILTTDVGQRPASLLKMSLFHRCFSNILLVKKQLPCRKKWVNDIAAHNFAKLVLLKAYNSIHKFDIICLSETYLDPSVLPDDSNLEIPGHNLVCSDHPSNKSHRVCIYYKSYFPLIMIIISDLKGCVKFELILADGIT